MDHEEKQQMAEGIKETAQNQPKRNKSQEHGFKDEESMDSLDVSVGADSNHDVLVDDMEIIT